MDRVGESCLIQAVANERGWRYYGSVNGIFVCVGWIWNGAVL